MDDMDKLRAEIACLSNALEAVIRTLPPAAHDQANRFMVSAPKPQVGQVPYSQMHARLFRR